MKQTLQERELVADELPAARVERRRWRLTAIWVVPIVAALVAGYLVISRLQEFGPTIRINFKDGTGVKAGQTEVRYRGVPVGQVDAVELSEDQQHVVVKARLRRSASTIAREGSMFWIVRPEVGIGTISGLGTVITGPYIYVLPGTGEPAKEFAGLDRPRPALERHGLEIVLATSHLNSIRPGSPIYYRGIQVGALIKSELNRDATAVHSHVFIGQRYARLVKIGSRFWTVSGLDVNIGLFKGVEISVESLRSLVAGGIAFATPEDPAIPQAKDGATFVLHDNPDKEWLRWTPRITLPPPAN
ncbi:MAG TPA: MlaD family protein [Methylomirabilota bacterium]